MSPNMIICRNTRGEGQTTSQGPKEWFTGDVWLDRVHADSKVTMANVTFTPCARTNWHTHENGQLLKCVAGAGWICDKGDTPKRLEVGDVVWCPPGTTHWHGADEGSYVTHFVFAQGKTEWHAPVTDEEYAVKGSV